MRIVFFGTPDFALPSLRSMLQAGHEIVSVEIASGDDKEIPDRLKVFRHRDQRDRPFDALRDYRQLQIVSCCDVLDIGNFTPDRFKIGQR